jgi:hypothetical protein
MSHSNLVIAALSYATTGEIGGSRNSEELGRRSYVIYRNDKQLSCLCCGATRFRLCSVWRHQPYFTCDGCAQRLEIA